MMKLFKKLLILALVLILIGGVTFTVAFAASGFNFEKMSGIKNNYTTFNESDGRTASKLNLKFESSDVYLKFDEQAEKISITYPEKTNKNGDKLSSTALTEAEGTISAVEKISYRNSLFLWNFNTPRVDVIIPKDRVLNLLIETDTGDVVIEGDATLTALSIETDTGDVKTKNSALTVSGTASLETDTGDVNLGKINASSLTIETDTGDVSIADSTVSQNIDITTDTGDITFVGAIVCETLKCEADTGDVDGEDAAVDAKTVAIETDTGDVELRLTGKSEDYETFVTTRTGDSNIASHKGSPRTLTVKTSTGDIEIHFATV